MTASCNSIIIDFKRGATFSQPFRLLDDDIPVDLTGWTIDASIEDEDEGPIADLVVTIAGINATAAYPDDTSEWPLGLSSIDIKAVDPTTVIRYSQTFHYRILDNITP